jgi:hypothetical protein
MFILVIIASFFVFIGLAAQAAAVYPGERDAEHATGQVLRVAESELHRLRFRRCA